MIVCERERHADLALVSNVKRPREAAVEVIRLINHRNTHIAMLALHVRIAVLMLAQFILSEELIGGI